MKDHAGFALKCCAFVAAAMMMLSGKPPSHAQLVTAPPESISAAQQDMAIAYNAAQITQLATSMHEQQEVSRLQGQDIARLDSKLTIFGGLVLVLQGSGVFLSIKRKKEE